MTDTASATLRSVCLFCGSSDAARPEYIHAARDFGEALARGGLRLVYGGGGVGLMGAAARAAHEAGGEVLGVMPRFLRSRERLFDEVETRVVTSMHERKQMMYDECDAFVVLPGGVGTLEEAIEVLSWKRLDLHPKPVRASLGRLRYLSAMTHCDAVVGNSSSGLIEAPFLGRPTINIGSRQEGRPQAPSVVSCPPEAPPLRAALARALTAEFQAVAGDARSLYGDGASCPRIVELLVQLADGPPPGPKRFHDPQPEAEHGP